MTTQDMNSSHPAWRFVSALALFLALTVGPAHALTVPEKLIYELSWTGITAGTATQEIAEEKGLLRTVSTARSADWLSVFYPIEDRIETTLSRTPSSHLGQPLHYHMHISEGKHRRDREINFDSHLSKAYYKDNRSGEKAVVPINDKTYDIYSSFYYIRFAPLEVGKSVFVSIIDGKEAWNLEVQVVKKEKLKTKFGTMNTFLLKPMVRKEGVFENKGDVYIWVSDDERRLPVKVQVKVVIGSITGTLVEVR
ncbi:MAG TPA: DUF3108 domain-containing protein [Geobacteraceae bacterium]